jgi:hypothetical protein
MPIYAVGNTPTDFVSNDVDSPAVGAVYSTNVNDPAMSPTNRPGAYMVLYGKNGGFTIELPTSISEFWMTYWLNAAYTGNAYVPLILYDGTIPILRFKTVSNGFSVEQYSGTAWVEIIPAFVCDVLVGARYDIKWVMSATVGVIEIYRNNILLASFYGNTKLQASTTINKVLLDNWRTDQDSVSFASRLSQLLIQSDTTRFVEVLASYPNGTATYQEQSAGVLADINEKSTDEQGDITKMIYTNANSRSAFVTDGIAVQFDTGWVVTAVVSNVRASIGVGSPLNAVAPMIRIGTTDAFSTNKSVGLPFKTTFTEWPVNPATGVAWTIAQSEAVAVGVRVATI